jgi:hypothetical protein
MKAQRRDDLIQHWTFDGRRSEAIDGYMSRRIGPNRFGSLGHRQRFY